MPAAIFARLKNALLVLLELWVSTTLAPPASPSLGAIRPVGAQRGTEIEVTLSGAPAAHRNPGEATPEPFDGW